MFKKIGKWTAFIILILVALIALYYIYLRTIVETKDVASVLPEGMQLINVGNETIAYKQIGTAAKTNVLFVGGLSGWSGTWERTMQAAWNNDDSYNYIAMDLPPFGYSTVDASKGYFRDAQADRIEGFVQALGLKDVILVTHSYGAGPGAEYIMRKPSDVRKFIIIDGVLNIGDSKIVPDGGIVQIDAIRNPLIGLLAHNKWFVGSRFKTFVYVTDNITTELMDLYMRSFNTKGTTVRLSSWFKDYVNDPLVYKSTSKENWNNVSIPVRLIWGDEDIVTPIGLSDIVLDSVPDVSLHTLKKIGHIPMIEDYALFDQALFEAMAR